ncbi:MAG: hypothetical protein AAGC83_11645 [Pseudomonadota bacterium]
MQKIYAAAALLLACALHFATGPASANQSIRFVVSESACQTLIHSPSPTDVTYQAGVDAYGRPVVPADLGRPQSAVPLPVTFDVTIDIAQRLGLSTEIESLLTVAQVSEQNGTILINGQPAGALGENLALVACEAQ